ncbi:TlpA family protein disulfide reductase [Pontimonas sp.]|nr:TlpA family protein disulfide reductase [Pontimonas sp.]
MKRPFAVMMVLASLATVSCTSTSDALAEQYRDGSGANYISGDGAITVLAPESRSDSVQFEGDLDTGEFFSSSDYAGSVIVVNFWYAGCPPCRVEAADLESLHQQFLSDGVAFVGVNIFDQAPTALTFANEFGVSYGSIMDVETGSVRLAFAGQVAPNAVPTTLVLDKQGRVSARISGVITDVDLLANIIEGVLEEELGS